jgi:Domain of unknown function (DUF397)
MAAIPKQWTKSSKSNNNGGCVEIMESPDGDVLVRDSKAGAAGSVLAFTQHEWACFVAGIHAGELQ